MGYSRIHVKIQSYLFKRKKKEKEKRHKTIRRLMSHMPQLYNAPLVRSLKFFHLSHPFKTYIYSKLKQ